MKTKPYVARHCWKALSLRIVLRPLKIIFIKGPVRKLHLQISAFNTHFPLKVPGSFKVLSLACNILWKYCIFSHNFCKLRQIHLKMLISICSTIYLQRAQNQWTNTLKEPCSYINFGHADFAMQNPFKIRSTQPDASRYLPIYKTFSFERMMLDKINASFRWELASFQVCGMPNSILWKNPALSKANVQ